ncbi:hypothetical protein ZWY2020_003173 [Hordeum vulgare]|nr:hypothetical protein ZWY2020_003173 [Hordeum vulgare]
MGYWACRRMSQHPSHHVSKGKKVVAEYDQPKRYHHNFVPPIPTSVVIHEPSNLGSLSYGSSDDEDVPSQFAMSFPTCSIITPIATKGQGEISKGRKRSYDSACYARLTPEQRKTRQDRQRARRQSLTPENRQEISARRRACMQSLPPKKRQALLNQHKASYKARRDTICDESVAMRCPALDASTAINRLSRTSASTTSKGKPPQGCHGCGHHARARCLTAVQSFIERIYICRRKWCFGNPS